MVLNGSGSANGGMYNNSRTNPAPLVLPDGGMRLVFRGGSKGYKVATGGERSSSFPCSLCIENHY